MNGFPSVEVMWLGSIELPAIGHLLSVHNQSTICYAAHLILFWTAPILIVLTYERGVLVLLAQRLKGLEQPGFALWMVCQLVIVQGFIRCLPDSVPDGATL